MKKQKKSNALFKIVLITLVVLLVAVLAVAGYAWWTWQNTTDAVVPKPTISVFGVEVEPAAYEWDEPLLGGLLQKNFSGGSGETAWLGSFISGTSAEFDAVTYSGHLLTLERDGMLQADVEPGAALDAALVEPGQYLLTWTTRSVRSSASGDQTAWEGAGGSYIYRAAFTIEAPPEPEPDPAIPAEPVFQPGRTELEQGDIFAMQVLYLPEGVAPTASTQLGEAIFTPVENGWFACVAVGNIRQPGDYPVRVQAGDYTWEATVTVLPYDFDEQNLIIDESDPVISEANSPKAIEEYNNVMIPMYATYDEEKYWEGVFIQPTQGRISTQFGEIRYTNGDYSNGRPHWGMDIAAAEGTEVIAPNNGRVVFSDYLLAVGNTVIIEHGGGLKSYYYHMSARHVEEGQMVTKGDLIGEVGTTGYSTGPHLHFEMRIGGREQVISPSMLFDPSAGLYSVGASFGEEEAAA